MKRAALVLSSVAALLSCEHRLPDADVDVAVPDFDDVEDAQHSDAFIIPNPDRPSEGEAVAFGTQQLRRTVFLNRSGGTFSPGADNSSNNRSGIIGGTVSVSPYEAGNANWSALVACIQQKMSRWDIAITETNPGAAAHIELVLGGRSNQLGMGSNIWGVAPLFGDCSTVERGIGYVFTADIPEGNFECETAVHELGHVLGLEHEYFCPDPMTYLHGCGAKEFQDSNQWCGTDFAVRCQCGGQGQNTVAHLNQRLGLAQAAPPPPPPPPDPVDPEDTVPPVVEVLAPAPDATLTGDGTIEVSARASDDVAVTRMILQWTFGNRLITMECGQASDVATCTKDGDVATWSVRVGTGARSFHVDAHDAGGNVASTVEQSLTLEPAAPPPGPGGTVTSPLAGAQLVRGQVFTVEVQTEGAVVDVDLWWITPNGAATHYDLANQGDGRWARSLPLSSSAVAGTRSLRIRVTDSAGAATVLPDRVVAVAP